jgi:hypothetical protein
MKAGFSFGCFSARLLMIGVTAFSSKPLGAEMVIRPEGSIVCLDSFSRAWQASFSSRLQD